ncbi:MAG: V-type ATP synthase subunit D [Thermodesulfobacteriota bacterium]|nr:V-type ATP synthase subunit D [Thermodesulfobacteriota bacterium]
MEKVRLTKTELKRQKDSLKRYNRYLPTLYIKKHQLQKQIERIRMELKKIQKEFNKLTDELTPWIGLLGEDVGLNDLIKLQKIETKKENIAGVDIPVFVKAHLDIKRYDLFIYPLWVDRAIIIFNKMIYTQSEKKVLEFQERCLQKELQVTSQRVNLFEKVKIPETKEAIRKILIYLGDQQIAAVGWARIAKKKIERAG